VKTHRHDAASLEGAGQATASARKFLAAFFRQHGYVRRPNWKRREREPQEYKKGWEVRLVAGTLAQLREVRRHLAEERFPLARAFRKHERWVQPIYGRATVQRFLSLLRDGVRA
jgi:hypothetical protein